MLRRLVKRVLWQARGGYKPKEFWDAWAPAFSKDPWQKKIHPQHAWIREKLKKVKPRSILEVGCGFGRNIKFLIESGFEPKTITGVDISSNMLRKARRYVKDTNVTLQLADVRSLPFQDESFAVVLVHGVLMHVEAKDVQKALFEIVRVTKQCVILVEQNYNGNEYTFVHNYQKLLGECNVSVKEYKRNKRLGLDYFYVEVR